MGEIDADLGAFVALVAAELAIDEGEPERATVAVTSGWAHLDTSDDTVLVGPLCALGLRAAADRAERARALRRPAEIATAEADGAAAMARAEASGPSTRRRHRRAERYRRYVRRRQRVWPRSRTPPPGGRSPTRGPRSRRPYATAYARVREAEASLMSGAFATRRPCTLGQACEAATPLGARPMLDGIDRLARRGRLAIAHG